MIQTVISTSRPRTRNTRHALAAPKLTAEALTANLIKHTLAALAYSVACAAGGDELLNSADLSDEPLDRFMTALYRITNSSEAMWQPEVIARLAPLVYALDAELDARQAGQQLTPETLQRAIQVAQTAALAALPNA
jgi:hypothetical protein